MKYTTESLYEHSHWLNHELVMGLDEAGRGPLCGPLVVAGVVFNEGYHNDDIYDSKKLSEKKREALYEVIVKDAAYYMIEVVEPKIIDELNIYQATKRAMEKIAMSHPCHFILSDAMPLDINKDVVALVKGDQKSISIAAASILAKVTRDHIMYELDAKYPQYELAKHKGYPTKRHLELLETYGLQDFYRLSYGPCARAKQTKLF